jgi:hypothetical protein
MTLAYELRTLNVASCCAGDAARRLAPAVCIRPRRTTALVDLLTMKHGIRGCCTQVGIPEYPASFAEHSLADLGLKKGEHPPLKH